jgi:hypothetical protein
VGGRQEEQASEDTGWVHCGLAPARHVTHTSSLHTTPVARLKLAKQCSSSHRRLTQ